MYFRFTTLKFLLAGAVVFTLPALVEAQNPMNIPSPETAIFSKNGNIPVNTYTGVPDISVPLFTIKDGDINLPISLSYNTSGIKVEEDAGWVGLGWALNAGGQITRAIRGGDDFGDRGYLTPETIENKPLFNNGAGGITSSYSIFYPQIIDPVNFYVKGGVVRDFNPMTGQVERMSYDYIPDMFYFNAGGNSGRFVCDDDGNPMNLKKSKIKITRVDFNNFKITAEDGLIYTFDLKEISTATWPVTSSSTSSWYLTKIESPNGKNVVNFVYAGGSMTTNPVTRTTATAEANGAINPTTNTYQSTINYWYLTEINYNGGKVKFESAADRTDVSGARRLTAVVITDLSNVEKKRYTLNSSYFHATDIKSHTTATYTDRLRLDNITVNSDASNAYTFSYNQDYIPSKESGKDHWGYANNTGFGIPQGIYETHSIVSGGSSIITYQPFPGGGDYESHWPYTQAMTLKQVTYPTKGYSRFVYETNKFQNVPDYWQYEIQNNPSAGLIMTYPVTNIDNGFVSLGNINSVYNLYCNFYVNDPADLVTFYISFYNASNQLVYRRALSDFDPVVNGHYFYLTVNNIALSGNLRCEVTSSRMFGPPVNNPSYFSLFTLTLTDVVASNAANLVRKNLQEMTGGGLRIKEIVNNDGKGETTFKQYEYTSDLGTSSGLIMNYPIYLSPITYTPMNLNTISTFSSASINALSTSASGSFVGYSRVKEIFGNSTTNIGSTVSYYSNDVDAQPIEFGYDLPTVATSENGLLLKQTTFSAGNSKLSEIENTYSLFDINWPATTAAKFTFNGYSSVPSSSDSYLFLQKEFQLNYRLLNSVQASFYNNSTTQFTQVTTEYQYQNSNPSPRRILKSTSRGDKDVTEYRYADDYSTSLSPGFVRQMQSKNILNKPVEVVNLRKNSTDERAYKGLINEYGVDDKAGLITNQYMLNTIAPIVWTGNDFTDVLANASSLNFNPSRYALENTIGYSNPHNQATEYTSKGLTVSYHWGYNNEYPVARCENALNSEFYYEGYEESTVNVSATAHTGSKGSTNAGVSWVRPNSRSYIISYWYYNNGWKYSGTLPYTSNSFTMTGGTAYDDVRIHPSDSQMTTYTYNPLVGITSETDAKGKSANYEYDSLQRLKTITDQNRNIVKNYIYHYKN